MKTLLKIFKNIFEVPLFIFGIFIGLYFCIEYNIKTKKEDRNSIERFMYSWKKSAPIAYNKDLDNHYAPIICFSFWLIIFWLIIL